MPTKAQAPQSESYTTFSKELVIFHSLHRGINSRGETVLRPYQSKTKNPHRLRLCGLNSRGFSKIKPDCITQLSNRIDITNIRRFVTTKNIFSVVKDYLTVDVHFTTLLVDKVLYISQMHNKMCTIRHFILNHPEIPVSSDLSCLLCEKLDINSELCRICNIFPTLFVTNVEPISLFIRLMGYIPTPSVHWISVDVDIV